MSGHEGPDKHRGLPSRNRLHPPPVPIDRDDETYFAPLRYLSLQPGTELSLGLLHKEDGIEGARRRMATARAVVSKFGVASECGMGREPSHAIIGLLDLHTEAAHELGAS